jgi:hypothetical protein
MGTSVLAGTKYRVYLGLILKPAKKRNSLLPPGDMYIRPVIWAAARLCFIADRGRRT